MTTDLILQQTVKYSGMLDKSHKKPKKQGAVTHNNVCAWKMHLVIGLQTSMPFPYQFTKQVLH